MCICVCVYRYNKIRIPKLQSYGAVFSLESWKIYANIRKGKGNFSASAPLIFRLIWGELSVLRWEKQALQVKRGAIWTPVSFAVEGVIKRFPSGGEKY